MRQILKKTELKLAWLKKKEWMQLHRGERMQFVSVVIGGPVLDPCTIKDYDPVKTIPWSCPSTQTSKQLVEKETSPIVEAKAGSAVERYDYEYKLKRHSKPVHVLWSSKAGWSACRQACSRSWRTARVDIRGRLR